MFTALLLAASMGAEPAPVFVVVNKTAPTFVVVNKTTPAPAAPVSLTAPPVFVETGACASGSCSAPTTSATRVRGFGGILGFRRR